MGFTVWQIILITVIAYVQRLDGMTTQIIPMNYMFWSCMVGAILGDFQMGLVIGATIRLMSLGVAALGGSSTPDYAVAAIILPIKHMSWPIKDSTVKCACLFL